MDTIRAHGWVAGLVRTIQRELNGFVEVRVVGGGRGLTYLAHHDPVSSATVLIPVIPPDRSR